MIRGLLYRWLMKLAHRFNWHYAPPIYPEGDTQLWCKWCGVRQTIKRAVDDRYCPDCAVRMNGDGPWVCLKCGKTWWAVVSRNQSPPETLTVPHREIAK